MELSARDFHELKVLEERIWMTEFRTDSNWMNSVLAEDFFEFGQSGRVYSREEVLNVQTGTIDAMIPLPDFRAILVDLDVVLSTYVSVVKYKTSAQRANRSSLWVRTDGGWKLKFHQGTPTSC